METNFKVKLKFIYLLIIFCIVKNSYGQEISFLHQSEGNYSTQDKEILFLQALSILPDEKVPDEYRLKMRAVPGFKCATLLLDVVRRNMDIFSENKRLILQKILDRPDLPLSVVSLSGKFRVHYDVNGSDAVSLDDLNNNQIPDYVEEVAEVFDYTYRVEIDTLGYKQPPDDSGTAGPEFDVYIVALRSGAYGYATITSNGAYIRVDNDYENGQKTNGIAGAKVTAAHEYFHAVQFSYRENLTSDELFYYELCSSWMEDVVYDEINDYYFFLPPFFIYTNTPFNQFDMRSHYYGEAVWNHFLVEKFKDLNMVRKTWEYMESDMPAMDAIDKSLQDKHSNFKDEFAEFSIWNYFTGSRADTINFYEEGRAFPEIKINGDFTISKDTTVVDSSLSLTHKYFRFTTFSPSGYAITGNVTNSQNWTFAAIIRRPGQNHDFHIFNLLEGQKLGFIPQFSEIVVIPINQQILEGPNLTQLSSKYSHFTFNLIQVSVESSDEQKITEIYPNPFIISGERKIRFNFTSTGTVDLEVRILNSEGRVIKTVKLMDGSSFLHSDYFKWDGRDEKNEFVSSGIYIFQLKQIDKIAIEKFAVIRE